MNITQEAIFQRALQSDNHQAVLNIARIFDKLGEREKSVALTRHVHSIYKFGAEKKR
jgi:hypothetical protein